MNRMIAYYCDGSQKEKTIGAGIVEIHENGEIIEHSFSDSIAFFHDEYNQENHFITQKSEAFACIQSLKLAQKQNDKKVRVYLDCETLLSQFHLGTDIIDMLKNIGFYPNELLIEPFHSIYQALEEMHTKGYDVRIFRAKENSYKKRSHTLSRMYITEQTPVSV